MKAIQLVKHGNDPSCFRVAEVEKPKPRKHEVLIKVQAFGLNYADVMARLGLYPDAPPLPAILGYEVVGVVEEVGEEADRSKIGKRVVGFTEFGGYAEYAVTPEAGLAEISSDMQLPAAASLATQYVTAYYMAFILGNIQQGEEVFIHAAAGGVGLALIELCKLRKCVIHAAVSSDAKAAVVAGMGVQHIINTSMQDVHAELRKCKNKLDVIFDSVGGKGVKIGVKALRAGGRMICYGGAEITRSRSIFHKIGFGLGFGLYSPVQFLSESKSILGVNMLKIMRSKPELVRSMVKDIMTLVQQKSVRITLGEVFPVEHIFEAHTFLQSRKSIGKIVVKW